MYRGKKKIIIVVIVAIIIIVLGAALAFMYLTTDLFKSNQNLFLKYAGQSFEKMGWIEDTKLDNIENIKNEKSYKLSGTATMTYEGEKVNSDELKDLKILVNGKVDKLNGKAQSEFMLNFKNQEIAKIEYANSNNIAALKWNEIVNNFYVGVKNENLNVLAQKIGNTNSSIIPDSISTIDSNELLSISEQEIQNVKDTYLNVIIKNISKDKYTKNKDINIEQNGNQYNTTSYRIDLNQEEVKNIVVAILEALKQDSITLNLITTKAKLLEADSNYTDINNLNNNIDKEINDIKNDNSCFQNGLSITVYEYKGQVLLTEILIKNEVKISISSKNEETKNQLDIQIENLSNDNEFNICKINLIENRLQEKSSEQLIVNIDESQEFQIYVDSISDLAQEKIDSNYEILIKNEGEAIRINYNQKTEFTDEAIDIINLDNTNCSILNDYTKEQLIPFTTAIIERVQYVINQKILMISDM